MGKSYGGGRLVLRGGDRYVEGMGNHICFVSLYGEDGM